MIASNYIPGVDLYGEVSCVWSQEGLRWVWSWSPSPPHPSHPAPSLPFDLGFGLWPVLAPACHSLPNVASTSWMGAAPASWAPE